MDFGTSYAPYEGGAGNLDNTIACTNAVNTASYNFNLTPGGYIAGNPAVVEGGTNPLDIINNEGGTYDSPLGNINGDGGGGGQCGGAKRRRRGRKSKRSKKLKRSNKSRLSTRSRKSKSKVRSKVKKVTRKTQNKSFRKSLKKKSRKSLK